MESTRTAETKTKGFSIVHSETPEIRHNTKTCTKCGTEYTGDLGDYFSHRKHAADGYRNQCRDCVNEIQKQRRGANKINMEITDDVIRDILKEAAKEIILDRLKN